MASKRFCACVIRTWGLCCRQALYLRTETRVFKYCRNSSSIKPSPIGTVYLPKNAASISRSIFHCRFCANPACLDYLYRRLPDHPAFAGIIVEVNGTEVTRSLPLVADLAKQMRFRKIAISIDDLGAEWPDLAGLEEFPFVEIKIDRAFVGGAAHDRLKRKCRQIVDLASQYGARTVAEGLETRDEFLAARDLGFDLIQGFLFARPMDLGQFKRTMLGQTDNDAARRLAVECGERQVSY